MTQRNRIYLAVLLLLLLVAGYYLWKEKRTPRIPEDQAFAVKDSTDIEKIVITDTKDHKVTLEKDGKRWKLNDTATAMPVKINFLLRTLASLQVEYPISATDKDRITDRIMKSHVKVQVYHDKKGEPDKVYYMGESVNQGLGNYALIELQGKTAPPYIVNIIGFTGDIRARFFTDPTDWRDLKVFDSGMDDIKRVTILYPYHPLSSFRLSVISQDSAQLEPVINPGDTVSAQDRKIEDELAKKLHGLSKPKVNDFLNSFRFINAESYDNEYDGKYGIMNKKPMAKVYLELKSGETDSIIIFMMPANQRTKTQTVDGEDSPYDLDRYYALIHHNKDFVVIQQFVFGKILRRRDDFYVFQ